MLEDVKPISFIAACRKHFGYRESEGLKEFSEEIKALTPKDREEMTEGFAQIGIAVNS